LWRRSAAITLANAQGYAVIYQQGFFFVQVIGSNPKLRTQIAMRAEEPVAPGQDHSAIARELGHGEAP
jgi:hypothetical protein